MGAALAYYSMFSLAPLLLIVVGVVSLVFGEQAARGEILGQIQNTVGGPAAAAIEQVLKNANQSGTGPMATVIGIVVLLFGASGVFVELQDSLNTIWKVKPRPGLGLWALVRDRLLSFSVILGTGFLLIVSLVVSAGLEALRQFAAPFAAQLPGGPWLWLVLNLLLSFALLGLLFAMIYRLLPDVEIAWGDVWFGALVTTVLFTLGKYLIGLYLAHSSLTSAFGAAGSVLVILAWVYYSAQIFLFGAALTRVHAIHRGSHIVPSPNAEPVTAEDRAQQGMTPHPPSEATNVPQPVD